MIERWSRDGVDGEHLSWANAWGPRTEAFVLRPSGRDGPLPAALALHCHSNHKSTGKEHVAHGPAGTDPTVHELRDSAYGGRAFANALARRGYVVLARDTFGWGTRGFSLRAMGATALPAGASPVQRARHYDEVSRAHETVLAKTCTVLGTSMPAVVLRDDRAALAHLRARADVDADRTAVIGMSGGGCRATMLQATTDVAACVVAAMMRRTPDCSTGTSLVTPGCSSHQVSPGLGTGRTSRRPACRRRCSCSTARTTSSSRWTACGRLTTGSAPSIGAVPRPTATGRSGSPASTGSTSRCRSRRSGGSRVLARG